jgi:hypothetical protein
LADYYCRIVLRDDVGVEPVLFGTIFNRKDMTSMLRLEWLISTEQEFRGF